MTGKKGKLVIGGKEYGLGESETGKFGVTRVELQTIILMLLRRRPGGSCPERRLFGGILGRMKMRPQGKARDELLRIYLENLRELKRQGKVEFVSRKVSVSVRLV